MNIYLNAMLIFVLLTALIIVGCSDTPVAPHQEESFAIGEHEFTPEGTTSHFTGRDSLFGTMMFGVNFTARVTGEWEQDQQDQSCKILNGSGSATHLGRILTVDQTICVDGDGDITGGEFSLDGRRTYVRGEYRSLPDDPTLIDGSLSAGLEITETNIRPTQIQAIDDRWTGWGWMNGELNEDNTFTYEIDGWLHHKKVEVPGLEDTPW